MTAMDAPAHFPRDEAELADWAVYGDHLQTIGDPRGAMIAADLALPARPEPEQIAAFHGAVARLRPLHYKGIELGYALGHVRTLEVAPSQRFEVAAVRSQLGPEDHQLARAIRILSAPGAHLIDAVTLAYDPNEHDAAWRELFARIPRGARVTIAPGRLLGSADALLLAARLAPGVSDVTIAGHVEAGAAELVGDWFDVVDFGRPLDDVELRDRVSALLGVTARVRVRVPRVTGSWPARIELGRPGDGALLGELRDPLGPLMRDPPRPVRCALAIPRWSLAALQRRAGIIGIRAQLAAEIAESYSLANRGVSPFGNDLVRRGARWTLRTPGGALAPVADRGAIDLDGQRWQLFTDVADAKTAW